MSFQEIKDDLVQLCMDIQDSIEDPKEILDRVTNLRNRVIDSSEWIDKNGHIRTKIAACMFEAQRPLWSVLRDPNIPVPHTNIRWRVNQADGWMDEAIRISTEAHRKGTPKPLRVSDPKRDWVNEWIESCIEPSADEYTTSTEVQSHYQRWMSKEAPNEELLSSVALGKVLSGAGYDKTSKWVDGKAQRVWQFVIVE